MIVGGEAAAPTVFVRPAQCGNKPFLMLDFIINMSFLTTSTRVKYKRLIEYQKVNIDNMAILIQNKVLLKLNSMTDKNHLLITYNLSFLH